VSPGWSVLVFTVTIYTPDKTFSQVKNAYVRLIDQKSGAEFCRYTLGSLDNKNGLIMCRLFRTEKAWMMEAIGIYYYYCSNLGKLGKGSTAYDLSGKVTKKYGKAELARITEITIIEGKNLASKDSNGLSGFFLIS
jgi:hypothetical protein